MKNLALSTYCLALLDVIADEIGLQGPSNTDDNIEDVVDENPSPSSPGSDSGQCADHGSYCDGARGDGYCDDYCNYADCNFDDGDCCGDDVNTLVCDECLLGAGRVPDYPKTRTENTITRSYPKLIFNIG